MKKLLLVLLLFAITLQTVPAQELEVTNTEISFNQELSTKGLYIEIYNDRGFNIEEIKVLKKDKGLIPINTSESQSGTYTIKLVRRYKLVTKKNIILEQQILIL